MTDHERVVYELKKYPEGLTSGEYAQITGSTKLTSRTGEMEKKGYVFDKPWETHNGKRMIRFKLVSEPVQFKTEGSQVCFA